MFSADCKTVAEARLCIAGQLHNRALISRVIIRDRAYEYSAVCGAVIGHESRVSVAADIPCRKTPVEGYQKVFHILSAVFGNGAARDCVQRPSVD